MKNFQGRTAVITGAGSGFGLELSRLAAAAGMNLVMADVQPDYAGNRPLGHPVWRNGQALAVGFAPGALEVK